MKTIGRKDLVALFGITLIIVLFFLPLFVPRQQLLVTPDFGKSDSMHFSFATKYVLGERLRQGSLPLWEPRMGDGFPLFAEGQIGAFFLPNLLLFRLLPTVTAYNLSLVLSLLFLAWGVYAWLRQHAMTPAASFFGGVTMGLSGLAITQLPHHTLIQGFSMMPWVLVAVTNLFQKPSPAGAAWVGLAVSQQFLAGFPQASFITLLFATAYFFWRNAKNFRGILLFGFSLALGAGLSTVQLLPSLEFLRQTPNPGGLDAQIASYFSFPLRHLLTFISPFSLGNPKTGTYPHFADFGGSIFWENTGYIGLLPLFLVGFLLFAKKNPLMRFLFWSVAISFLLMWGSHSPLYFLHSFWPFNLFRVPSRFLWIFLLYVIALAAGGFDRLIRQKSYALRIVLYMLLFLHIFQVYMTWKEYHLLAPSQTWLDKPETAKGVKGKIASIGSQISHNAVFFQNGWQDGTRYQALRNSLAANTSILWDIPSRDVYAGRFLHRSASVDSLLAQSLTISPAVATPSGLTKKILDLTGVRTLVSTVPLDQNQLEISRRLTLSDTIEDRGQTFLLYQNPGATPRAYLVSDTIVARTVEETGRILAADAFFPGRTALVETDMSLPASPPEGEVDIVASEPESVIIRVTKLNQKALLVLTDTWYPGWTATVEGSPVPILTVNIKQRGILLEPGDHEIIFHFVSQSFVIGSRISLATLFLTVLLMVFPGRASAARTPQEFLTPRPHRPGSRARRSRSGI